MKIYIRTNVNKNIGLGHLSRCSRLIKYFNYKGFNCEIFLDHPGSSDYFFFNIQDKIKINYLYNKKELFLDQKDDANKFLNSSIIPGIVFVDDYRINHIWEKIISKKHLKIIAIEDINNKKHFVDYIINSNPKFIDKINYNNNNLKQNGKLLLGPKYSILNQKQKKIKKLCTITFYFGGSGNIIYFYEIIKKLSLQKKFKFFIIVGPLLQNKNKKIELFKKLKNLEVIDNLNDVNKILCKTSILISSAGMISVESAHYQIPSILFQISDNQLVPNFYLEKIGMYFNLKKKHIFKKKKIIELILNVSKNITKIKKNLKPTFKIDSKGIKRIFDQVINNKNLDEKTNNLNTNNLNKELILINDKAINRYLIARNLFENRINSNSLKKIDTLNHYNWWLKKEKEVKVLKKKGVELLFIKNDYRIFKDTKFCINGWIKNNVNLDGLDVLWALKQNMTEVKKKDKKIIVIGLAKKNNKFANFHTKYLKYKLYGFENKLINSFLLKEFKNLKKFNVYIN